MIKHLENRGFTLIELLIATTVFAVIMLISTYGFLRISHFYNKGINLARVQNQARNIATDISQQLQLTSSNYVNIPPHLICIGNKAYTYNINSQENGTGSSIYSGEINGGCASSTTNKKILLSEGTRLLKLSVVQQAGTDLYNINIKLLHLPSDELGVAYPYDLVEIPFSSPNNYDQWRCKTNATGGEYCAISEFSTTVLRRLGNGS